MNLFVSEFFDERGLFMGHKPTYEQLEKRVLELEQSEIVLKQAMKSLTEVEKRISLKPKDILSSKADIDALELSDVIDVKAIQSMMDDFHALTNIGIAILDASGNILVATGWQDICVQFHRKHPETLKNCLKSDLELSKGVEPGTFRLYKCKNNMWDMATPIVVGDKRLGSLYLGQFFFEDETPDLEIFRSQARQYGFDEEAYLQAFDRVPRWKRETVDIVMSFYTKLATLISELGYSNIRLAGTLKERTRILNALEKRERFLNEMGRMARIGGWEHDLVTHRVTWTKGIYDIVGLKTDVAPPGVDEQLQFCLPNYRKILEEAYRQTLKGGTSFDLELEIKTTIGERLWCRVYGEAVMSGGKCIKMRGIFQDINERRLMERELARARKLESMGFIAGGLVHDYNNLLSMILGNISTAKEAKGQGEFIDSFLDDAEEATLKAKDLTHRLMTLSKESVSHKRLRSVKDSLEVCAGEVPSFSKCVCDVDIDDDLWLADHDPVQLKYAIRNVIKNAVEAMPKGGVVSLRGENTFLKKGQGGVNFPENPGAYLKISVIDQGVGITRANLGRIFDPYFSTKETEAGKGMGLGLSTAAAIVDKHDGHLAVNSKRGIGTTVQIYLPARPPDDREFIAANPSGEKG